MEMKRTGTFPLALILVLSLVSCTPTASEQPSEPPITPAPTESVSPSPNVPTATQDPTPVKYDPVEPIDFWSLLDDVSATRRAEMAADANATFEGFADYLVDDPSAKALLTQKEINELTSYHNVSSSLTYEEAASDVDLFFRTLKYGYGAYYYFGGDPVFNAAKENILNALAEQTTLSGDQLGNLLYENLLFVKDGHFSVDHRSPADEKNVRYRYYYCADQEYARDENGYYKTLGEEKWYYQSCSHPAASMQPILTLDGALVYSPVLFCPSSETDKSDTITLCCGDATKTETVEWLLSWPFISSNADIKSISEGDIVYASVRCSESVLNDQLVVFEESAFDAKNADLVIIDIRAHGGGNDLYAYNWLFNFTGRGRAIDEAVSTRFTSLNEPFYYMYNRERYQYSISEGTFIENGIPIILLVDANCGSAGESMISTLRSMANVLVVGSNSSGSQLVGNVRNFSLPNSGIEFRFGFKLQFTKNMVNIDGMGHTPDIWCDSINALPSVLNMLTYYDLSDPETVAALQEKLGN